MVKAGEENSARKSSIRYIKEITLNLSLELYTLLK